jgi:cellulose synthase/poly-beta-1,6-N-acetylglucosamine synthase-like glycosyltransferase
MRRDMSLVPKLSFIVLSYNYADLIGQAIRSILEQTVQDFEIVVVDDASTDGSCDVVRSFLADPRIRLLINDRNIGGAASYNRAVEAAHGEYLVNLDADDWIPPNKCEAQLAFLGQNKVAVLGTYATFVDRDGCPASPLAAFEAMVNQPLDNTIDSWISQNRLMRSSTMVEREAHLSVGLDDPSMVQAPDYELWTRFLRKGYRFAVLPEKLVYCRVHSDAVAHEDPRGTILEMSYATLRNLVPIIEQNAAWPSLIRIIRSWLDNPSFVRLRPIERYRLLGMLLGEPPAGDFASFRRIVVDGAVADGKLVMAGRRLLAIAVGGQLDILTRPDEPNSGTARLSEETIRIVATEVSRELRSDETIKAVAAEVWRERRRRWLPFKLWTEISRAWRRPKRRPK